MRSRSSFQIIRLSAIFVFLLSGFLFQSCSSTPDLQYYFKKTGGDCKEAPAGRQEDSPQCLPFLQETVLIQSIQTPSYEYTAIIYPEDILQRIHRYLKPDVPPPGRNTGLILISVELLNTTGDDLILFRDRFQIQQVHPDRTILPLTPEQYRRDYYGYNTGKIPYAFAFLPSTRAAGYLQKIPEWYKDLFRVKTGSRLEEKQAIEKELQWTIENQNKETLVKPGELYRVILPFPLLEPKKHYRFSYQSRESSPGHAPLQRSSSTAVVFLPEIEFEFAVRQTKGFLFRRNLESMEESRARQIYTEHWKRIDRDRADLFKIHRQLRKHQKLKRNNKHEIQ